LKIFPIHPIHLFILSVAKEYNGRRIAQNLVDHCIQNAQIRCYKTIFAEATNHASQHILKKSDFKNIFSIYYKDYLHKNGYVFSKIKDEEATKLMEYCIKDSIAKSQEYSIVTDLWQIIKPVLIAF
jgi:ribosomal protein S18 acetylase RimI-like enzyme